MSWRQEVFKFHAQLDNWWQEPDTWFPGLKLEERGLHWADTLMLDHKKKMAAEAERHEYHMISLKMKEMLHHSYLNLRKQEFYTHTFYNPNLYEREMIKVDASCYLLPQR